MAFQGSLKELPLPDIIQLVSVAGKTGAFTLKDGSAHGEIYLRDGQITHAKVGELEGEDAIYELAVWPAGEFVFTPAKTTGVTSIRKSNTNLLMEAARRIDEWQVLSKRIPSTRLVPVFTGDAARTSVSLTPQEWGLICKIDERRTIEEVALAMGVSPFDACKTLYGLITSGLVSLKEDLADLPVEQLAGRSEEEILALAERVHQHARQMLAGHENRLAELDSIQRLAKAEIEAGRHTDAILDLIRSLEKVVSSALGPNQSKTFLEGLGRLFQEGS